MEHFRVDIKILCGSGLSSKDAFGKSDPYMKVMKENNMLYKTAVKTNTLYPEWNEHCEVQLSRRDTTLKFMVLDYDVSSSDDFIGEAILDVNDIELNESIEMTLQLSNYSDTANPGKIVIRITIREELQEDQMDGYPRKMETFLGIVWVLLIEASGLKPTKGTNEQMFFTLSLMKQDKKSKKVPTSQNPVWTEHIPLDWYTGSDNFVELSLFNDKDIFTNTEKIGRCSISLKDLSVETTHNLWLPLKDGLGKVHVLVTVTSTEKQFSKMQNTTYHDDNVGHLIVDVLEADGLEPKLFGQRRPFVVVELVNQRVQTRPRKGVTGLEWSAAFDFYVTDIHSEIEVTVLDDDDKQFLGKVIIPLTHIQSGDRRWYRLKNNSLRKRAKGEDPRILLEMNISFDIMKAALKMFLPKERKCQGKPEDKLKMSTINFHISRIREVQARLTPPDKIVQEVNAILSWTNPAKTGGILYGVLVGIWYLELWMVPLLMMGPFVFNLTRPGTNYMYVESISLQGTEDDVEEESKVMDAAALLQKAFTMQVYLECVAHALESFENVFNFSDLIVSGLPLFLLLLLALILFVVPFRLILMMLTIRLFSKSLYNPLPTNKLYNFMSRVQDKQQMMDYMDLPREE